MEEAPNRRWSIPEAAKRWHIPESWLYQAIHAGELHAKRPTGRLRGDFVTDDIMSEWLDGLPEAGPHTRSHSG